MEPEHMLYKKLSIDENNIFTANLAKKKKLKKSNSKNQKNMP